MTHLTRLKKALWCRRRQVLLTVLSFRYDQMFVQKKIKSICTCVNPSFMLGQQAYLNYIITKAFWAAFCSSGMKRSPITLSSKNMGSEAEQRIKSILWSDPRQSSSNKTESNGKIKVLNVWTLQHYSSGLLNGVLSRHDNSMERESNCHGNRSPWGGVAYRYLSLLQVECCRKF